MGESRKIICNGTRKNRSGEIINCTRIIAEVDYVRDARVKIKCGSCGTMNIIEATVKPGSYQREEIRATLKDLGNFPIERISV